MPKKKAAEEKNENASFSDAKSKGSEGAREQRRDSRNSLTINTNRDKNSQDQKPSHSYTQFNETHQTENRNDTQGESRDVTFLTGVDTNRDRERDRERAEPRSPFGNVAKSALGGDRRMQRSKSALELRNSRSYSTQKRKIVNTQKKELDDIRAHLIKMGRITPGPGNYQHKSTFDRAAKHKQSNMGRSFINKPRMNPANPSNLTAKVHTNPGPGTHKIKPHFGNEGRKSHFGGKSLDTNMLYNPNFKFPAFLQN